MSIHEIVLAQTKPETEWVRGRALQKMSATNWHASLQALIAVAMREWADAGIFGRVGTEWRFRVAPPGDVIRPLVPDVAYLSYAALPRDAARELVQIPLLAPTVAVEILSPDDSNNDVADKIAKYLSAGSLAVLVVDPDSMYDRCARRRRVTDVRQRGHFHASGATRLFARRIDAVRTRAKLGHRRGHR